MRIFDWFTGYGRFNTLEHCMAGDLPAILFFAGTSFSVTVGYLFIAVLAWRAMVRNKAEKGPLIKSFYGFIWTFILCAFCGYVFDVLRIWWPSYNFFSVLKIGLILATYTFAYQAWKIGFFDRVFLLEKLEESDARSDNPVSTGTR